MESWEYRVEPYRANGPGEWSPADETTADTWFLFGKKGNDERIFGVFSSRVGAEAANEYLIDWAATQNCAGRARIAKCSARQYRRIQQTITAKVWTGDQWKRMLGLFTITPWRERCS